MELILATKNQHKVEELRAMLREHGFSLSSLFDYPEIVEPVEDGSTFQENALKKARSIWNIKKKWVLADDSGLVVEALGGAPGIYSSRYGGKEKDYQANNEKLLREMAGIPDGRRQAAFVCVMALIDPDGNERVVEGRTEGVITMDFQGHEGFGYDPLFFIPEKGCTMAELPMDEKNAISHRGRALAQVKQVLLDILGEDG